ncbi:hypothetical protein FD755_011232 [Muntiacus reevesi]|uniref:Uncharacterized protein n=2 Tax=Muntiacus TaxID=9885 RepID=A0A5N3XS21_MUNRE|nr:hypothetical protein FD754_006600 [Muntiacus muntjak]KAB0376788.1 hypothetical protein FD755_011232 [Muntiacus reevesi]
MMQHASPAPALTMMATQNVPPPAYQDSPQWVSHPCSCSSSLCSFPGSPCPDLGFSRPSAHVSSFP